MDLSRQPIVRGARLAARASPWEPPVWRKLRYAVSDAETGTNRRGRRMRVVICGGGVIGACIAYFLSRRGAEPVVVERTALACAASGKSGGFLALDWCDGTQLDKLARRSFALHASLPHEIGGKWGYRALTTYGGSAGAEPHVARRGKTLPW